MLGRGGTIAGYLNPDDIVDRLVNLTLDNPGLCAPVPLAPSAVGDPQRAPNGFRIMAVRLRDATVTTKKIPVLFTGGMHGREWVPPDALLHFAELLVEAKKNSRGVAYPTGYADGVYYENPDNPENSPYVVSAQDVRKIFDRFDIIVLPLVNPDSRWVSGTAPATDRGRLMWRKNRRRVAPGACVGVDLNRNFDIGWDFQTYYDAAGARQAEISDQPCSERFRGPAAHSEPETRNVIKLLDDHKIEVFVDVHMFGRTVTYPWAVEGNQSTNSSKSFTNTAFDHLRDGIAPTATLYGEYLDDDVHGLLADLATAMVKEIAGSGGVSPVARLRSTYRASQSAGSEGRNETYPGGADDFAFSRQFTAPPHRCVAFTIECGMGKHQNPDNRMEDEGGFHPEYGFVFPKIEREVHAGLFGLLKHPSWASWNPP
ncbi:M14 family zinc carboxypeptidase [Mycolicibacterium sp. CR10]|uniref:M14 family zinc carboxypeptidase n=1 Tax=Mycolicibacterium sp. CR10 TaxID=2562314 RepID=UPI001F0DB404|nr:M14 family zinc carboxypeptidase [Mycolicibacterium sp. CR10]